MLFRSDGHVVLQATDTGDDPDSLGRSLARRLLDRSGGAWLLESLQGLA